MTEMIRSFNDGEIDDDDEDEREGRRPRPSLTDHSDTQTESGHDDENQDARQSKRKREKRLVGRNQGGAAGCAGSPYDTRESGDGTQTNVRRGCTP